MRTADSGQDVDSDGNVDSATYLGCYSIPEENMADLRGIPSNAALTQEVSPVVMLSQSNHRQGS